MAGRYRAKDLLLVPGVLSLLRIPLAAVFPFVADSPGWAVAVLISAGATDVLDGWWARRFHQVTPTGTALDPITDKLFVLTVATTLVVRGHLSLLDVVLLSTRELGELPLVLWLAASAQARRSAAAHASANVFGKAATTLQFASVMAVLLHSPQAPVWIGVTAVAGGLAAASYTWRAIKLRRVPVV